MRCFAAILAFAGLVALARGQETIFNVPSPDVLEKGRIYFETDQYVQRWKSDVDDVGFGLVRGVYGLSSDVEVGLNAGPFDYEHSSVAFLDGTVKWRPLQAEFGRGAELGTFGFFLGDNLGVHVNGDSPHDGRNYTYAAGFVALPAAKTRISAGPYYATEDVFAPDARFGAQLTLEQPIVAIEGLTLAADWYSGDGGAATSGFVWAKSPWTFYLGYGFANSGRDADVLTLELGVTL